MMIVSEAMYISLLSMLTFIFHLGLGIECPPIPEAQRYGDIFYYLGTSTANLLGSHTYCESLNMSLARIFTLDRYEGIINFLGNVSTTPVYVDLSNEQKSGCNTPISCVGQFNDSLGHFIDTSQFSGQVGGSSVFMCLIVEPSGNIVGTNCGPETPLCSSECLLRTDGSWGAWSSWSSDPTACGSYARNRTRSCNNPAPSTDPPGLACIQQQIDPPVYATEMTEYSTVNTRIPCVDAVKARYMLINFTKDEFQAIIVEQKSLDGARNSTCGIYCTNRFEHSQDCNAFRVDRDLDTCQLGYLNTTTYPNISRTNHDRFDVFLSSVDLI